MNRNLVIYEGAMCCSTGICGPEPDKELVEFTETLKKLQNDYKDLNITRASLSFNVGMFLENNEISRVIREEGLNVLPIVSIDGKVVSKQKYPKYVELKREVEQGLPMEM